MPEIIFQTQRLYKIAGRRHRCIIILLRRAWLKIHHISMQTRVPRGAAAFRCSCQLKGILIRDKQSAGILCFSISGLYSLNELWISERFLVEIWAPIFWSGKAMLPLGNHLVNIHWMRWDIQTEAGDVLTHSILEWIEAAAIKHLPHGKQSRLQMCFWWLLCECPCPGIVSCSLKVSK